MKSMRVILALVLLLSSTVINDGFLEFASTEGGKVLAEVYQGYNPEEDCKTSKPTQSSDDGEDEKKDSSTSDKTSSAGASDTDWSTKGAKAYQNMKDSWDAWVEYGLNGKQIAGILGNVGGAEDTGFVLDMKEVGGSGGGLYQFTPYTKYTSWSGFDGKWSAKNQVDYIIKGGEPETVKAFIEQGSSKSPTENATLWANLYERPAASALSATLGKRQEASEKIYKLMDGDKVKQDDDKIAKWAGGKAEDKGNKKDKKDNKDSDSGSDSSDSKSKPSDETDCQPRCDDGKDAVDSSNTNTKEKTSSEGVASQADKIDKFVKEHEEAYLTSWKVGGYLPSVSIAQTQAEVSFNEDVPSFGKNHNTGGVKWAGDQYPQTKKIFGEDAVKPSGAGSLVGDGNRQGQYAYFKSYDAGIVGKAEFIAMNSIYAKAVNNTDPQATMEAIANAGYAEDGSYLQSLKARYEEVGKRYQWLDKKAIEKYGKTPFKGADKADNKKSKGSSKDDKQATEAGNICSEDGKSSSSAGGTGWQKKGGNSGYTSDMYWKRDDLPDKIKQYAIDPQSVGMKWKSSQGWDGASAYLANGITNQCTTLSAALIGALWEKDGKPLGANHGANGNGNMMVSQMAQHLGTPISKNPTSGDLISLFPNHTAIVSHVFDNGDILICEQNVPRCSGEANGEALNWSYSLITKANQEANGYTFTNPSKLGYTVSKKAKSVG